MSKQNENLKLLRQMLNQEVNSAVFNPDVRDRTPESIIILIKSTCDHVHCIKPDDDKLVEKIILSAFHKQREIKELLKDTWTLLLKCVNNIDFSNGVTHSGMDKGEVNGGNQYYELQERLFELLDEEYLEIKKPYWLKKTKKEE